MTEIVALFLVMLLWSFLVGELTLGNLVVGLLLGLLLLAVMTRGHARSLPMRVGNFIRFLGYFAVAVVTANILIALLILRGGPNYHPHIIAVPLRVRSDSAISVLSACISLFPGTVAMGLSEDKRILYAHSLGIRREEDAKEAVRRMETMILRFMY